MHPRPILVCSALLGLALLVAPTARASYLNFESSHVHPIALTPDGSKLLAVNTPDALLEIFTIDGSGAPVPFASVPVGLEPVTVVARTNTEAWVVNQLSDTVSIVDLGLATTVRTLRVGNEPLDVAFAAGKAFVAVSQENAVKVYDLSNLAAAPAVVPLFSHRIRALAVSPAGTTVYAVAQDSGNQTAVVDANVIFGNNANLNATRLAQLGIRDIRCPVPGPPAYPPLPAGISRNPALIDPPSGIPRVGLVVRWNGATSKWVDDAGQDWTPCLPFRMPDHDLFAINSASLAVTPVAHLGTTLFEVSVQPGSGKVYVPHTEARNLVRFEHALGVRGHVVDNRIAVVNPAAGNAVTTIDLNTHIDRGSDPATNLVERRASISQPGMMTWRPDGTAAYLTAIGSRKLFRLNGACLAGSCIFGASRPSPDAVEVGEGPTGVAFLPGFERLFVLNRFSNSIAVVDAASLTKMSEIPLHDPSPGVVRSGRKFLYDAALSSGHGDAACSTCHIAGDKDGLSWDLGDPEGELAPYSTSADNVRFVIPQGGQPAACDPAVCASHQGFDPQKGPMSTQTLRGMLEPLHWRGDRATMNQFNPAFVGLLGAHDAGPVDGKPAGLSAADMEMFRQFALGIQFPPNPFRRADDTQPNAAVSMFQGVAFSGNPTRGSQIFDTFPTDAGQPCVSCHQHPFGTAGGQLGGVTPTEPTSPQATALFNGNADQSPHSDLKISHLRNLWDKPGFEFGPAAGPYPDVRSGSSIAHDGSIPNLLTFFSFNVFNLTAQDVRDVSAFMLHFPTGTRPAVGQSLTVPAGAAPTGSAQDEALLTTLLSLGDLSNSARHCELTASTRLGGGVKRWRLATAWVPDRAGDPLLATAALRQGATDPITFTCGPVGSGIRLGGDRDEDGFLNRDDCASADGSAWAPTHEIAEVLLSGAVATGLSWNEQATSSGPGARYDVAGATLSALRSAGPGSVACLASGLTSPFVTDTRPNPPAADGNVYLVRARNACGTSTFGPGRAAADTLVCP